MSDKKSSFIKIAPGAKVKGLAMTDNIAIGDIDFINNEGELEDVTLRRNVHIVPRSPIDKRKLMRDLLKGVLTIVGSVIAGLVVNYLSGPAHKPTPSTPCAIDNSGSMTLIGNSFEGFPCAVKNEPGGSVIGSGNKFSY